MRLSEKLGRLGLALAAWMASVGMASAQTAKDPTEFKYSDVSQDVSDISFYRPSESTEPFVNPDRENEIRNVIFMIGDGMGTGHVLFSRIRAAGPDGRLFMERMPVLGLASTHSASSLVTDSAAAGTALACGVKTNNKTVGMDPDGVPYESLLEAAADWDKRTGLVVTCAITNATPAVFSAHVRSRGDETTIAEQQLAEGMDVILGGGRRHWMPQSVEGSRREDDRDLMAEALKADYSLAKDREELLSTNADRILGLFQVGSLSTFPPEPMLAEMTARAIATLTKNGKSDQGFFLMVEGSLIDHAGHNNNADNVVKQTLMFDQAVKVAVDFALKDKHTLVLVTADHETGGLAVRTEEGKSVASWSTKGHSAQLVPVYAFGSGSEVFAGVQDNTDIPRKVARLMGVGPLPRPLSDARRAQLGIKALEEKEAALGK